MDLIISDAETKKISCWQNPKFQHFCFLFKFFLFSVVLITADIVSDIDTALEFLGRGDLYWGLFTMLPIFAPFFAKVVIAIANFRKCIQIENFRSFKIIKNRFNVWKHDLIPVVWDFPLLQPVRYYSKYFKFNVRLNYSFYDFFIPMLK